MGLMPPAPSQGHPRTPRALAQGLPRPKGDNWLPTFDLNFTPITKMEWFGSQYYQKLYRHRNHNEAQQFIDSLIGYLTPAPSAFVVDVCCGRGRHSLYLAQKGFNVWGIDKSLDNIAWAKKFELDNLHFTQGDIRCKFEIPTMQFALNLFTSFGYFDSDADNLLSMQHIRGCLDTGGMFVLDYLNEHKAVNGLVPLEFCQIDEIEFEIKRQADHRFITKQVRVDDGGRRYEFIEQVRRYRAMDFEWLLAQSGFSLVTMFGDYSLGPFEPEISDRLIICAKAV
jgi:SAM-dependent methyltransferase